jgi:hypothetical protein
MGTDLLQLVFVVLTLGVLPVVINKSTEGKRFDWLHPHLRIVWTVLFVFYSWYLLTQPRAQEVLMWLHQTRKPILAYPLLALVGAILLCGYYWFAGKVSQPASGPLANPTDQNATPVPTTAIISLPSPTVAATSAKTGETKTPKIESRTQAHEQNLKQPSTINQTMTNSPSGIQAGRDVTVGRPKPSPTATEKDKKR